MAEDRHMIWSNWCLKYEDWKADLEYEYPNETEERRREIMYETNNFYLDDERMNLDIQMSQPIIVLGSIGLWDGVRSGYKMIDSGNIKDCLYDDCEANEWYVDKDGEFRGVGIHHDGRNSYHYRVFKPEMTSDDTEELQNLIYERKATEELIDKYTDRLGDKIGTVYGWEFTKVA